VGVFLCYARAIDNTMLVALGTIASQQASATETTAHACIDLLNYVVRMAKADQGRDPSKLPLEKAVLDAVRLELDIKGEIRLGVCQ